MLRVRVAADSEGTQAGRCCACHKQDKKLLCQKGCAFRQGECTIVPYASQEHGTSLVLQKSFLNNVHCDTSVAATDSLNGLSLSLLTVFFALCLPCVCWLFFLFEFKIVALKVAPVASLPCWFPPPSGTAAPS